MKILTQVPLKVFDRLPVNTSRLGSPSLELLPPPGAGPRNDAHVGGLAPPGAHVGEVKMITSNSQGSRSRRQTALHIHSAICWYTYDHDLLAASSLTSRTMPAGKSHSTNTDHR
jgi:hypothetical protein